jgi:hypothetical protein
VRPLAEKADAFARHRRTPGPPSSPSGTDEFPVTGRKGNRRGSTDMRSKRKLGRDLRRDRSRARFSLR